MTSFVIQGRLDQNEKETLLWIIRNTFESEVTEEKSFLRNNSCSSNQPRSGCPGSVHFEIEVGPRLNFSTAFSTNAVAICNATGLHGKINRIERSTIYLIHVEVCKSLVIQENQSLLFFCFCVASEVNT